MATYTYQAIDSQGQAFRDEIEATSKGDAVARIREQGYYVADMALKGEGAKDAPQGQPGTWKREGFQVFIGAVSARDLTMFTRQFATLLDAGLPVVQGLRTLERRMKPGLLKYAVGGVIEEVEGGDALSDALGKFPRVFDTLYVSMVKTGEAGGVLDPVLKRLADLQEKSLRLRTRVGSVLLYPAVSILVMGALLSVIMTRIIPQFRMLFEEMQIPLPVLTEFLVRVSSVIQTNWYLLPGMPLAVWGAYRVARSSKAGRWLTDLIALRLPFFGTLTSESSTSRFCRTLGTLTASGVPLLDALTIARDTTENTIIASVIQKVQDSVRQGEGIAASLSHSSVIDPMVADMINVGERTGGLDKMLLKIADTFDDDVDAMVGRFMTVLEPALVLLMALMVGFVVFALFQPLLCLFQCWGCSGGCM